MSDTVTDTAAADAGVPVLKRLSTLDRFLPVWIIAAMALGIGLGRPIPSLAKVSYTQLGRVTGDRRALIGSLLRNWIIGPALMFTLARLLLPDLPAYRTGLIIVGLARCIAMVLIWNELACGDRDAAVVVAINSAFQIIAFAALGWFYLLVLPRWLGLSTTSAHFSITAIVVSVLVFLGIPLVAGYLTRTIGERTRGQNWYEFRFLPAIGPGRPGVDARAGQLGLSRVEYVRRRLAADAATTTKSVSVAQLRSFAAKVADLAEPEVIGAAWR